MVRRRRLASLGAAAFAAASLAATGGPARAGDDGNALLRAVEKPPAPQAGAEERPALVGAVEKLLGTSVHGRLTTRWDSRLLRGDDDETDHDFTTILDARVGDETRDEWSGAVFTRAVWDLDQPNSRDEGRSFSSLADTYDHELSALLHTAVVQWRPKGGEVEAVRFGRQYVDVAESFHLDGAWVESRPVVKEQKLRFAAYGGVPVHFYEPSPSGDVIAGVRATAEPWKGGRAALDYTHVQDEIAGYDEERNDLAAAQVWHRLTDQVDLFGRFTWLDEPRDAKVRGTLRIPDQDLVVQASYFRLLDDQDVYATEFDPYYATLRTLHPYHLADARVVKGLAEGISVECGGSVRELVSEDDEGEYNRETWRLWVMPTFDDLLWEGSSVSLGGELWDGQDEKIETWTFDLTHRFSRDTRFSVGTDFAVYDYDRLELGEREDVRSVYGRLRAALTETISLDARYAWERDEEETYHVITLALAFDF